MIKENDIETYLIQRVKDVGGECRKVKWLGRQGAPDRLVGWNGRHALVELKAPGEKAKPHQLREHDRLRSIGCQVEIIDSYEGVDALLGL